MDPSDLGDIAANADQARLVGNDAHTRLDATETQLRLLEAKLDRISMFLERQAASAPMTSTVPPAPSPGPPLTNPYTPVAVPPTLTPTPPPFSLPQPRTLLPPDFDGDRRNGRAFLTSVLLHLTTANFPNDQARINWTLMFFKSGRAATYARSLLDYQLIYHQGRFSSWAAFEQDFIKEFCPLNERQDALVALFG